MTGTTVAHLLFDAFILMMGVSAVIFKRCLAGEYDPPEEHTRPWDWQVDGS